MEKLFTLTVILVLDSLVSRIHGPVLSLIFLKSGRDAGPDWSRQFAPSQEEHILLDRDSGKKYGELKPKTLPQKTNSFFRGKRDTLIHTIKN